MDIFDRINKLITDKGITGAELSRDLGLSNSIYSQWKSGATKPSPKTIKKIADYFGVSAEYIRFGTKQQKTPSAGTGGGISERKKRVIQAILNGSDEDAEFVQSLYEKYINKSEE